MIIKQTVRYASFLCIAFMYATPCTIWGADEPTINVVYGDFGNLQTTMTNGDGVEIIKIEFKNDDKNKNEVEVDLAKTMKSAWEKLKKKDDFSKEKIPSYFQKEDNDFNPANYFLSCGLYRSKDEKQPNLGAQFVKLANSLTYDKNNKTVEFRDFSKKLDTNNNDNIDDIKGGDKDLSEIYMVVSLVKKEEDKVLNSNNELALSELMEKVKDEKKKDEKKKEIKQSDDWAGPIIILMLIGLFVWFFPEFSEEESEAKINNNIAKTEKSQPKRKRRRKRKRDSRR